LRSGAGTKVQARTLRSRLAETAWSAGFPSYEEWRPAVADSLPRSSGTRRSKPAAHQGGIGPRRKRGLPLRPRLEQRFQPCDPFPQDADFGPQALATLEVRIEHARETLAEIEEASGG